MYGVSRRGHTSVIRALRNSRPSPIVQRFLSSQPSALQCARPRLVACTRNQSWTLPFSRRTASTATAAATPEDSPAPAAENGPITRFQDLGTRGMVCETVVDTLTRKMNLETMTEVQSKTINAMLKGDDVLAQARTGTGKTLAFLIPVLQRIIAQDPALEDLRTKKTFAKGKPDIRAVIISPTRELAEQIAEEARKLVARTSVVVQTAVGGTGKKYSLAQIQHHGCHILVGTPGRLNDILSDPEAGIAAPNLDAFVLDEADRLLDDGFAPEIKNIKKLLPKTSEKDHQTLMVSATVPNEVMRMVEHFMKPGHRFVRTVRKGEQQTHTRVPQAIVNVKGPENMMPALLELIRRERAAADPDVPFKAMVFFNANAEVRLDTAVFRYIDDFQFRNRLKIPIIEIHSKLEQRARTEAARRFRESRSALLFSSDVTSRGMDFPNVTHVIQIGVPASPELYVHRLGRTARGNKQGQGWLFATPIERDAARKLQRGLPLQEDTSLATARVDMTRDSQLPEDTARCLMDVLNAAKRVPADLKSLAFRASMGFLQRYSVREIMPHMNSTAVYGWGMDEPPAIPRGLAAKLGVLHMPDVRIADDDGPRPESRSSTGLGRPDGDRADFSSGRRPMRDRSPRSFGEYDAPERFGERDPDAGFRRRAMDAGRPERRRPSFDAERGRPRFGDNEDGAASDRPRFPIKQPWQTRGRIGSRGSRARAGRFE